MKFEHLRHFLLDMDGTVYLGDRLIPGAVDFIQAIRKSGRTCLFITNNSSKSRIEYAQKLALLGIDASPDDVFTSGEASARHVHGLKPGALVYLLGTSELENEFRRAGFLLSEKAGENPDFVVLG